MTLSPIGEFLFFTGLILIALCVLVVVIVVSLALYWTAQDYRHLRARAKRLADEPALDTAITEAVPYDAPRLVEDPAAVYRMADWRRGGAA